ncbi:Uu.00g021410.m01.CDS01 [Anthostomella pinea]|uniref:Uu.00g021410.m01.CDS01 n=1 Tax=Anthostomella pinea TaxID=933095 RepID=A0AAI8VZN3_9PEZI|nr:Uu.00g021410.m01.CDS01 [Anthostomella pinea]
MQPDRDWLPSSRLPRSSTSETLDDPPQPPQARYPRPAQALAPQITRQAPALAREPAGDSSPGALPGGPIRLRASRPSILERGVFNDPAPPAAPQSLPPATPRARYVSTGGYRGTTLAAGNGPSFNTAEQHPNPLSSNPTRPLPPRPQASRRGGAGVAQAHRESFGHRTSIYRNQVSSQDPVDSDDESEASDDTITPERYKQIVRRQRDREVLEAYNREARDLLDQLHRASAI